MIDSDIPTRVGVLEHGVQELKAGLDSARSESRDGFGKLESALGRLVGDVAKKAHPINWFGIMGSAAAAVAIMSGVFGLAEWRISNAQGPVLEQLRRTQKVEDKNQETVTELKIMLAVEQALRKLQLK